MPDAEFSVNDVKMFVGETLFFFISILYIQTLKIRKLDFRYVTLPPALQAADV